MADCAVTMALSYGAGHRYVGNHIKVGPVVAFVDDTYWNTADFDDVPLTDPPMVLTFEVGKQFGFIEPDGTQVTKVIPAEASTTYAAIPPVVPVPAAPTVTYPADVIDTRIAAARAAAALDRAAGDRAGLARVDFADKANLVVDWATVNAGGAVAAANAGVSGNYLVALNNTNPGGTVIPFLVLPGETAHIKGTAKWMLAAAACPLYIGVDSGTPGHAPVTGTPDGIHMGFTSAAVRTDAMGSSHAAALAARVPPVAIGSNPAGADTDYSWAIDIDLETVSFHMRKVGSATDLYSFSVSRAVLANASKVITGISLYLTATAGGASHKIGPIVATKSLQPGRTRTIASIPTEGVERIHDLRLRTVNSTERWRKEIPKDYNALVGADVALFCKWAITSDDATAWSDSRMQAMTKAISDAGMIFAAASDGGIGADRYGAPVSLENYIALYQHIRDNYATRKVFLVCASGGGITGLNLLSHPGFPTPAGIVMIAPATNLRAVYDLDNLYAGLIRNAYGIAADGSDYAARTATYDPALRDGADFRAVPSIWFTSPDDAVVPPATHVAPMVAKLSPFATAQVETQSGTHLAADQFQVAKTLAFINARR